MLFDQIAKERPEGVTLFLFRQGGGYTDYWTRITPA
jgi:hypothetical protein